MKCKCCQDDYTEASIIEDFEDNVCLPCRVQKEYDENEQATQKELDVFNATHGTDYTAEDANHFYIHCGEKLINKDDLLKLPLLLKIYDWMMDWNAEIEWQRNQKPDPQLNLFVSDLPF